MFWVITLSWCRSVFIFFQSCGESATTPSIIAACPCGWSRTIAVPSASRTGWFRESANKLHCRRSAFRRHLNASRSGARLDNDHCNVLCREQLDIDRLPSYLWLHVPVVLVSKGGRWTKLKQRRLVGHRLVDVDGGDQESRREGWTSLQCLVTC